MANAWILASLKISFCFDSAEVQKTMHNSYYPECICQELWQLGINLRLNWWCELHAQKRNIPCITPKRSLAISYIVNVSCPKECSYKFTPPPTPTPLVSQVLKCTYNSQRKESWSSEISFYFISFIYKYSKAVKVFCKSAIFVSLNYRVLLCDFDKIQHPREIICRALTELECLKFLDNE